MAEDTSLQKLRERLASSRWFLSGSRLSSLVDLSLWLLQNLARSLAFSRNLRTPRVVRHGHLEMSMDARDLQDFESSKTMSSSIFVELRLSYLTLGAK